MTGEAKPSESADLKEWIGKLDKQSEKYTLARLSRKVAKVVPGEQGAVVALKTRCVEK